MYKSIIKIAFISLLAVSPTIGFTQEKSCTGKIQAITSRAGIVYNNQFLINPIEDSTGNMLSIKADFSGETDITLCSLDSSVNTGTSIDIDPANIDPSMIPPGFVPPVDPFINPINVSSALCQQWFTSVQLALALDLSVTLTYPEGRVNSCNELNGSYPTSLRIAR